jgi:sugar/nucleoside kinase (ribokinase family)
MGERGKAESKKVIVAGHICLDVTPVFGGQGGSIAKLLTPGTLVQMNGIEIHTGGCVANTGLAMKMLGARVQLLGKIGQDEFGSLILQKLSEHGYDGREDMIVSKDSPTSYSIVLNIPGNDRIFLHDPGANDTFISADVDYTGREDAALIHFGYPPLMAAMYRDKGAELADLFARAHRLGISTSLDMAAVDENGKAGQICWEKLLERVIPQVDFFLPSAEELCFMLDRTRFCEWKDRAGGDDITKHIDMERDIRPLADRLMDLGAKVVVIKCGTAGLYYRTADAETLSQIGRNLSLDAADWAEREGVQPCYVPDRILSAVGAGDTCIAAFLTAILQKKKFSRCIELAAAAGACCVTSYDALDGLQTIEEMEHRIEAGWRKSTIRPI